MRISDWSSDVCSSDLALAARVPLDAKAFARLNADFFYELSAMTGNLPLKEISERLYFQTFRIWLQAVPRLNLADEAPVFQREMADVLAALQVGLLEAVGHIRRRHISMSFRRIKPSPQAKTRSEAHTHAP